jgi:RNA polymerase sigma-70 factor (ECF subfamily)
MAQMPPEDAEAIALARAGDEEGYRVLVERHSRAIYQLAFRITGRREDAEDVVQDTFIKAFRQLATYEARSAVSTWLYRIAANCAIDTVRRRRPQEQFEPADHLDRRASAGWPAPQPALVEAAEIQRGINGAMASLSTSERAAFVMRHFQACSIDEIAGTLGMKPGAAKHAVFRAVRKMRAALGAFADAQ